MHLHVPRNFASRLKETWPLLPAALYLLTFLIVVLSYLIGLSFSTRIDGQLVFPSFASLNRVTAMPEFGESFVNTLLFMIAGTPLEMCAGLFLALVLYINFPARNFVKSILVLPLAIPTLVTATLLFILFDFPGGHINHLLLGKYDLFIPLLSEPINWRGVKFSALGISLFGKVWRDTPISMLIILAGLNAIDPQLFDAARTMGAGFRKTVQHVVLPLIIPSLASVVLLRSIEMWKEFIFPFILAGQHTLLGTLIESLYNNWGHSNEAAVVALFLVVCVSGSTLVFLLIMDRLRKRFYRA